jgi:hypothetical protein
LLDESVSPVDEALDVAWYSDDQREHHQWCDCPPSLYDVLGRECKCGKDHDGGNIEIATDVRSAHTENGRSTPGPRYEQEDRSTNE